MPRVPPGYGPGAATFFGGPGPGYWNAPGPGSATSAPSSSVRSLAEMSTADTGQDDRDDSSPFGYTSATTHQVLRGLVGGSYSSVYGCLGKCSGYDADYSDSQQLGNH